MPGGAGWCRVVWEEVGRAEEAEVRGRDFPTTDNAHAWCSALTGTMATWTRGTCSLVAVGGDEH